MENVSINKEEMLKQRELLETQMQDVIKNVVESERSMTQLFEKDGCIPLEQIKDIIKDIINNVDLATNLQETIISICVLLNDQEYLDKTDAFFVLEHFKPLSKVLDIISGDSN